MAQIEALIEKFKELPADFTWREMRKMLMGLGFTQHERRGSRVMFHYCKEGKNIKIMLHKPHPEKEVDKGAMADTKRKLEEYGFL